MVFIEIGINICNHNQQDKDGTTIRNGIEFENCGEDNLPCVPNW